MYKTMIDSHLLVKLSNSVLDQIKQLDLEQELPSTNKSCQQSCDKLYTTAEDYEFISSVEHKLKYKDTFQNVPPVDNINTFSSKESNEGLLQLPDLVRLNNRLQERRKTNQNLYLHEILLNCAILVPANETVDRNPELEKRCNYLKTKQDNLRYRSMTKDVDRTRSHEPEETIAYQMKQLNKQLIAVFQFIVSVLTGFLFGFIGIELIVGNLDFGFRLLLGIMSALTVALAELYFLAKQLNEYP